MAWDRRIEANAAMLAHRYSPLLLFALASLVPATGLGQPRMSLTPRRIEMGSFYSGAALKIEGLVGVGSKPIVVVRGADRDETFNKKVRFGPIWLNSGSLHISGAPSLFLCFSPEPVGAMLDPAVIRGRLLDEASIQAHLHVQPEPEAAAVFRSHFLALKKEDGLYQVHPGRVRMGDPLPNAIPFSVEFQWPKIAPPASYTVTVLECRDLAVVAESSIPLEVIKVGFPLRVAAMANENAVLYGLAAVLAAALAGFAIDFLAAKLFGKRRRVAH